MDKEPEPTVTKVPLVKPTAPMRAHARQPFSQLAPTGTVSDTDSVGGSASAGTSGASSGSSCAVQRTLDGVKLPQIAHVSRCRQVRFANSVGNSLAGILVEPASWKLAAADAAGAAECAAPASPQPAGLSEAEGGPLAHSGL